MPENSSKSEILGRIRNSLIKSTGLPFKDSEASLRDIYPKPEEPLEILFARSFSALNGGFVYCKSQQEFIRNLEKLADTKGWKHLFCWEPRLQDIFIKHDFRKSRIGKSLDKADASVTSCEALVARTGSILMSSRQESGRTLPVFPPVHIVVAYPDQIVFDIENALQHIRQKYGDNLPSMITLESGPSRTADIEKTLVLGAHGPKELYVFLIDQ